MGHLENASAEAQTTLSGLESQLGTNHEATMSALYLAGNRKKFFKMGIHPAVALKHSVVLLLCWALTVAHNLNKLHVRSSLLQLT